MELPKFEDFDLEGKTVLVRADLDVPLRRVAPQGKLAKEGGWEVADTTRLENCLPTIEYLLEKNCRVVLLGHLGRPLRQGLRLSSAECPQGKLTEEVKTRFSLQPVAEKLEEMLGRKVGMIREIGEIGGKTGGEIGEMVMLENLRFWPGEEKNDEGFAKQLASLGEFYFRGEAEKTNLPSTKCEDALADKPKAVYVNECFACSHREHASIVGIPKYLPYAGGLHLVKEVEILSRVLESPKRPVIIVIGGAKEEKLKLIPKFLGIADFILIGGWLLKRTRLLRRIGGFGGQSSKKIFACPVPERYRACLTKDGKDITVESAKRLGKIISQGGTVVWSGPMGVYEDERDIKGTKIIAEAIANSKAFKVAGGGDTEAVIDKLELKDKFDWISSGGGAMLEFLAEGTLVGIEALRNPKFEILNSKQIQMSKSKFQISKA